MSNFEEEKPILHAKEYHKKLKKVQQREAERASKLRDWENDKGLKPSLDAMGGPVKTDEEMHREAWDTADRRVEEKEKLDKSFARHDQSLGQHQQDDLDIGQQLDRKLEQSRDRTRKRGL